MTKFAAVDCGTNSIRLLISEVHNGVATDVCRLMEIVRLGKGVDGTGELAPESIERARLALARYVELMKEHGVQAVRMVATSATRDARNKDDFFAMTGSLLGQITPGAQAEVISGEEEASLSFRGAVSDLEGESGPFCVIDLGGGSTEFIVGESGGEIYGSHSAQMGCVRLTERIMRADPPTDTEIEIARDYVTERIEQVEKIVPIEKASTFVGCAGTFTTLAAMALGLESYDPGAIHDARLRLDALQVITAQLIAETAAQRAAHPVMHPGRADVIAGGSVVVDGVLDMLRRKAVVDRIVISEKDILDGIIAGLAEAHEQAPPV